MPHQVLGLLEDKTSFPSRAYFPRQLILKPVLPSRAGSNKDNSLVISHFQVPFPAQLSHPCKCHLAFKQTWSTYVSHPSSHRYQDSNVKFSSHNTQSYSSNSTMKVNLQVSGVTTLVWLSFLGVTSEGKCPGFSAHVTASAQ